MRPDSTSGPGMDSSGDPRVAHAREYDRVRPHGAGSAMLGVGSSRFAAPSLRYGPSGDTTPSVAHRVTMAVSKLPAMADRRAHSLGQLKGRRRPPYTTQEKPFSRPRSRGLENRKSNCRRQQKQLTLTTPIARRSAVLGVVGKDRQAASPPELHAAVAQLDPRRDDDLVAREAHLLEMIMPISA